MNQLITGNKSNTRWTQVID